MDGKFISMEELVKIEHTRHTDTNTKHNPIPKISNIPTVKEIIAIHGSLKKGKGLGEDLLGSEILKLAPIQTAMATLPLNLKATTWIWYPIQWKGGQIIELFKKKGDRRICGNSRDITLTSAQGKPHTRLIRKQLQIPAKKTCLWSQTGSGLTGAGTDFGHLAARAALDIAKCKNLSCAIIFADLSKAFTSMARSLAIQNIPNDEALLHKLRDRGYNKQEIEEITMGITTLLSENYENIDEHTSAQLQDLHTNTWATTEYIEGIINFNSGTLAGGSLADIVFTLAMTLVCKKIRKKTP